MADEDLTDLLERELALLDDCDDDDDAEFNFDAEFLHRSDEKSVDPSVFMEEEMNQLMLSANELSDFQGTSSDTAHFEHTDLKEEEATEIKLSAVEISSIVEALPSIVSVAPECELIPLTVEETLIIVDLLALMVESVERCAPITQRTVLSPTEPFAIRIDHTTPVLTIISDDSQVPVDPETSRMEAPSNDRALEISLLDDRLQNEAKLERDAKIISTQEADKVLWDETNRFKLALEQERSRIEERKRKREEAKRVALREKASVSYIVLSFYGYTWID